MRVFVALGLLTLGVMLGTPSVIRGPSQASAPPSERFPDGYRATNVGPCAFADVYPDIALLVGQAVRPLDGLTQPFAYARVRCLPDNPPASRFMLEDLGLLQMRAEGYLPIPGSAPPPIIQAYLARYIEAGLLDRFLGRVISGPLCDGDTCRVFTEKAELHFPKQAQATRDAEKVTQAPLGCQFTLPCARFQQQRGRGGAGMQRWLLAVGVAAVMGGLLLLLHWKVRSGFGRPIVT